MSDERSPAGKELKHRARTEFESWAASYDHSALQRFVFQPSYRAFLEHVVRWCSDRSEPFDILDVGCGTGTWLAMLAATELPARRLVGLDYSAAMCRRAHEKARDFHGEAIQFIQGDSEHLPFGDGAFDVLTCSNSFHHYPHQLDVLREFRRVLRPGGRLMIIDGFRDNVVGWIAFDVIVAHFESGVHHAPWSTMRSGALSAGFRRVEQEKLSIWIPLLITIAES